MDKKYFFDRNLLALSRRNQELCSRLSVAETTQSRYKFLESRGGDVIPAWVDPQKAAHPLHSIMDPRKEAKRLIDSMESAGNGRFDRNGGFHGFLILLGLGGGYYAEAALERDDAGIVLVIDYGINGLAELLCHRDYARIFGDPRFILLADNTEEELQQFILDLYQPVLYGGIKVIPLLSRTSLESSLFARAGNAISAAIEKVSADYSVQAHFGKRWFSNIIRNLESAEKFQSSMPPIRRAAVCAAGPSLSQQLPLLKEKKNELFLIASDTSLPCLLDRGIQPDAVISIDCQHISYYHFMDGLPEDVLLFLDLASPPLLSSLSARLYFFSGGHPLTRYISRVYRSLPELDTSGGNVTYAAISLAEQLGAHEIELYGADFSYPSGISYARGTYIYPYFGSRQNRFSPLEAQASAFLYRTPIEKKTRPAANGFNTSWYYETKALKFYREKLEEKSKHMEAAIIPSTGLGAPISLRHAEIQPDETRPGGRDLRIFSSGKAVTTSAIFLEKYRSEISKLAEPGKNTAEYLSTLKGEAQAVFATLLPAAAVYKRHQPRMEFRELFEETRTYCLKEIDTVLSRRK